MADPALLKAESVIDAGGVSVVMYLRGVKNRCAEAEEEE